MDSEGRDTALVLSGGGSKGALQAGLYRALCEVGWEPDFIVGTSVGALNGAFIAAGVGPKSLARGWAELSRGDLFAVDWSVLWRGLGVSSVFSGAHFTDFLEEQLPVSRFEDLKTPLHVVSTHLSLGEACRLSDGDLVQAVRASCSIPGLLPPARLHGDVPHVDGSLGDNLPIALARQLGAERVVAMNCRTCDRCSPGRMGLPEALGRAFSIAADCTLRRMADRYRDDPSVLLLQPDIGEHVYALDFSHGRRLVEAGYEWARPRLEAWLAAGGARPA
ncbi:MAG: patatin-like phospholipase family protein [Gemmatimonadota bacterium]